MSPGGRVRLPVTRTGIRIWIGREGVANGVAAHSRLLSLSPLDKNGRLIRDEAVVAKQGAGYALFDPTEETVFNVHTTKSGRAQLSFIPDLLTDTRALAVCTYRYYRAHIL